MHIKFWLEKFKHRAHLGNTKTDGSTTLQWNQINSIWHTGLHSTESALAPPRGFGKYDD